MKRIAHCLTIALTGILLLAAGPFPTHAQADGLSWSVFHKDAEYFKKVQSDPRRLVEEYCGAEYNGVQDIRLKVAKITPRATASDRARRLSWFGSGEPRHFRTWAA